MLSPGTRVEHPDYGTGTVQDKRDSNDWVLVIFDSGEKVYVKPENS